MSGKASSDIYIDGSTNPGTAGTQTIPIGGVDLICSVGSTGGFQYLTGNVAEVGVAAFGFTTQKATVNSNQRSYWGF